MHGQVTVPRIFIVVLYFFMHVLHCLKQEKVKGDRVNFPYRLYSVVILPWGQKSRNPRNSQSSDADFGHVNSPSGLTRICIFDENFHATLVIKWLGEEMVTMSQIKLRYDLGNITGSHWGLTLFLNTLHSSRLPKKKNLSHLTIHCPVLIAIEEFLVILLQEL